jgi:trk system potassium uptake protein
MSKKFAVIGLGIFGSHLAVELAERGAEVLAIDNDLEKIEDLKEKVTVTVKLDSTDETALRNQGIEDFDAVIVAMGDNFEASILTVAILQQIGVQHIIVRGTTSIHKRILNHLGIEEIILPSEEAADKLASSLAMDKIIDSFSLTSEYIIVEAEAPKTFIGKNLLILDLPKKYEISIITIKRRESKNRLLRFHRKEFEEIIGIPKPETIIEQNDILVLFGKQKDIESLLKKG